MLITEQMDDGWNGSDVKSDNSTTISNPHSRSDCSASKFAPGAACALITQRKRRRLSCKGVLDSEPWVRAIRGSLGAFPSPGDPFEPPIQPTIETPSRIGPSY